MGDRKRHFEYFLVSLVFCILITVLGRFGFLNFTYDISSSIFSPIRVLATGVVSKEQDLAQVSEDLEEQKIKADMEALRSQFAVFYPRSQNLLPAKVIGMPSFIPGRSTPEYLILDRGENDGVRVGQAVVLSDNLVGKIDRASKTSSRVILSVNKNVSFSGKTDAGAIGVVRGTGDGIEIGNILPEELLGKNAKVLSKGDQDINGSGIPPDLIIGKIISVEKDPSALFQKAQIRSLVDFTKLNMVFVLIK